MGDKKEKSEENSIVFTHDPDASSPKEMPSISRLLNRKKLNIAGSYTKIPPAPSKAPTLPSKPEIKPTNLDSQVRASIESAMNSTQVDAPKTDATDKANNANEKPAREISISFESSPEIPAITSTTRASTAAPQLQRRKSDRTKRQRALIHWDKETLSSTRDPLGKGLAEVIQHGTRAALYLSIQAPPSGKKYPLFNATACYGPSNIQSLWKGIHWDPSLTRQAWAQFLSEGVVEVLSSTSDAEHSVLRMAFGATTKDHLYLVRIGPIKSCRGLLVLLSEKNIKDVLVKSQDHFFAQVQTSSTPKAA